MVARWGTTIFETKDDAYDLVETEEYTWPLPDDTAESIAKRDIVKIAPTALHAQNLLGLLQQLVMNFVYLSSGRAKVVNLTNGRQIEFKHTVARNLAFTN